MTLTEVQRLTRENSDQRAIIDGLVDALRRIDLALGLDPEHLSSPEAELAAIAALHWDAMNKRPPEEQ